MESTRNQRLHLGVHRCISLHIKYAGVICSEKRTVPSRAKLEVNSELRGTDNVQEQFSEHILKSNGGYFLDYPNTKIGEYHSGIAEHIQSRDTFRPIACERKYLMGNMCNAKYLTNISEKPQFIRFKFLRWLFLFFFQPLAHNHFTKLEGRIVIELCMIDPRCFQRSVRTSVKKRK